jgi:hypothetical protein
MTLFADPEKRQAALATMPRDALLALVQNTSTVELLSAARASLGTLGIYRLRVEKQERVSGTLLEPQVIEATIRESPLAIRAEFTAGPSKGRRLLYSAELRPGELRVREKGVLGLAGAVWIGIDNPLARRDSNHRITDLAIGSVLTRLLGDLETGQRAGGHERRDLGLDARGRLELEFIAPPNCPGLLTTRARVTIDLAAALIVGIETHDAEGLLERYGYQLLEKNLAPGVDFTWSGPGRGGKSAALRRDPARA